MPSPEAVILDTVLDLFPSWPVGEQLDDIDHRQPLISGIHELVRRGLREQCAAWPREWSTDGIHPARCLRTDATRIEIVGTCEAFTAGRGSFGPFPVRASITINIGARQLDLFACDVGEFDPRAGRPPGLPEGSQVMMLAPPDSDVVVPQVVIGRRAHAVRWTRVIEYRHLTAEPTH